MKINSVSSGNYSNQAFSGSIKISQKSYGSIISKQHFMTDQNGDKLLETLLKSIAPQVTEKPKFIVGSQIEILNKCINYVTNTNLKADPRAVAWVENAGNSLYKFSQGTAQNSFITVLKLK